MGTRNVKLWKVMADGQRITHLGRQSFTKREADQLVEYLRPRGYDAHVVPE